MTDQTLIMNKLNKWFWYYGVLPLVISYIICLNFAVEFFQIKVAFNPSITKFYMAEMLGYTTLGLAFVMIVWCNVIVTCVHKISSKLISFDFKIKKYILNISVIFFPIIAFLGFIPIVKFLFDSKFYFPLFPIIEPIAQQLTPYFFPTYLFIIGIVRYIDGNFHNIYS